MMIKRVVGLGLCLMGLNFYGHAEAEIQVVTDISLVPDRINDGLNRPTKLVLGVEMAKNAYYKLSDAEEVIKGGLFHRGLNLLTIENSQLFERSATLSYFLDLKVDELTLRKEIEIDIQMDSGENERKIKEKIIDFEGKTKDSKEGNLKEKREIPEYKLSMFIGGKLITSSQKLPYRDFSPKVELPPSPGIFNPFGPIDKTNPAVNSVPILDAVGAVYGLIKDLISKKKEKEPPKPIQRQKQVTITFLRRTQEGKTEEVKAVIALKDTDEKTEKNTGFKN